MYSDGDTIYYRPERSVYRSSRQGSRTTVSTPLESHRQEQAPKRPMRQFDTRREEEESPRETWASRVATLEATVAELHETIARLESMLKDRSRPGEPAWRAPERRAREPIPPLEEIGAPPKRRRQADREYAEPQTEHRPSGESRGASGIKTSFFAGEGTTCMLGEPRITE